MNERVMNEFKVSLFHLYQNEHFSPPVNPRFDQLRSFLAIYGTTERSDSRTGDQKHFPVVSVDTLET